MISDDEKIIYTKLYDISRRNLRNTGREFIVMRDVFANTIEEKQSYITAFERERLSKCDFIQLCYLRFLARVPEQAAIDDCLKDKRSDRKYKMWLLEKIIKSEEFLVKTSTDTCMIAPCARSNGNTASMSPLSFESMKSWNVYPLLRRIFHIFPLSVRIAIKNRILGVR